MDNDIVKAMGVAKDLMAANADLIGFFADNNHTGDGVARAIVEEKVQGKIMAIAFDSDPEEVKALAEGTLYALVLQDPFGMGYKGVDSCLKSLAGAEAARVREHRRHGGEEGQHEQARDQGPARPDEQEEGWRLLLARGGAASALERTPAGPAHGRPRGRSTLRSEADRWATASGRKWSG